MAESAILAPDIYVNASVALGSPPEHVVRRFLGGDTKSKTTDWVLSRVDAMLRNLPQFKPEAVDKQMELIRGLVTIVETEGDHDPDAWEAALVDAAKAAGVKRIITDHPDLADKDPVDGIEFVSSDAWLVEQTTPPPPPGG